VWDVNQYKYTTYTCLYAQKKTWERDTFMSLYYRDAPIKIDYKDYLAWSKVLKRKKNDVYEWVNLETFNKGLPQIVT
jgi:hypothetical protein